MGKVVASETPDAIFKKNLPYILILTVLLAGVGIILYTQINKKEDKDEDPLAGKTFPPEPIPETEGFCIDRVRLQTSQDLATATIVLVPAGFYGQIQTELAEWGTTRYSDGQVSFKFNDLNRIVYDIPDVKFVRLLKIFQNFSGNPNKTFLDFVRKPLSDEYSLLGRVYTTTKEKAQNTSATSIELNEYGSEQFVRVSDERLYENGCQEFGSGAGIQVENLNQVNYCLTTTNCEIDWKTDNVQIFAPLGFGVGVQPENLSVETDQSNGQSSQYGTGFISTTEPFTRRDMNIIADIHSSEENIPAENVVFFQHDLEAWTTGFGKAPPNDPKFKYFYYVGATNTVQANDASTMTQFDDIPNYPNPGSGNIVIAYPRGVFSDGNCPETKTCTA